MIRIDLCQSPMRTLGVMTFVVATTLAASAQAETNEELAMQLSNPVAALISVPFQFNYDQNIGSARDGKRWVLNIQPVVPLDLNAEWNLISRTILPVVWQDEVFPGAGSQSGIGDTVQSVFFSPKAPTAGGLIWGVGPVLLLPTGSNDLLTTDKWGAGPTGVVIRQQGPWTVGRARQPYLVVCREQQPRRCQRDVHAAVSDLHDADRDDVFAEHGKHL